ncbi:caspase family protein [Variovorax sp. ZS18.2.2]|uniref:caspase family protein n=1 Tax=Variovorax sp. ZS18.2.2 TaxID=2971255 RepID=UPI002151CF4E|nr:caspase family protein [Variovorax sp. ZS18.2.2]MCR6478571.1 caspase family protein [Variovorax sp. ZS18.2.2]
MRLLLSLALLVSGSTAFATQRALLVGVSELVNQPQALWLQAPRNDVMLMRDALLKQGFASADITVLADGVSGSVLPESQAIHEALGRLLAQSKSGDFVLLYFSGHGTRLRDSNKRYQEPDGLSENFLARDVRGTLGADSALTGDLRDADFDAWIQAFLARNVFVASVFDTCSANSMTRSTTDAPAIAEGPPGDEVRWRGLRTTQLIGAPGPAARVAMTRPTVTDPVPRARYVALFASESHQITPELRLPRKNRNARPQGLLTWAVVEALSRKPATWRDLFDGVLAVYPPVIDELAQRFPTRELPSPVAEGNLDAPIFSNRAQAVSTRPVWRAQRSGDTLTLQAGQLDGLVLQQPLRVLATMDDGTVRSAEGTLAQAFNDKARMAVPPALRELPGAALWNITPLGEPATVALRVRAEQGLPPGLSLEYPASVVAVNEVDGADVRWSAGRLEVLSPQLGAGAKTAPIEATAARRRLEVLARLKWLNQLYTIARDAQFDGFDAVFEVWNGDRLVRSGSAQQVDAKLLPLRSGERAVLNVRNTSARSVDLVIVGIDPQGGARQVYPEDPGETNRFKRGTREAPATKRFELPWFNAEGGRLLVLATPAAPYSAPRLFGTGAGDAVAEVRVRGALQPEGERQTFAAMVHWAGEVSAAK